MYARITKLNEKRWMNKFSLPNYLHHLNSKTNKKYLFLNTYHNLYA